MDNKTKISKDLKTHYISIRAKFEEFILTHEAMNAQKGHLYAHIELIGRKKIIKSPWET